MIVAFSQQYPDDAGPEFRSRCLERLRSALAEEGSDLENLEKVKTERALEYYYRAGLRGTDLIVYIYDDGAEVLGPNTDRRFEWQGFASLDELCKEFVQTAVEVYGRATNSEGSSHRHRSRGMRERLLVLAGEGEQRLGVQFAAG